MQLANHQEKLCKKKSKEAHYRYHNGNDTQTGLSMTAVCPLTIFPLFLCMSIWCTVFLAVSFILADSIVSAAADAFSIGSQFPVPQHLLNFQCMRYIKTKGSQTTAHTHYGEINANDCPRPQHTHTNIENKNYQK